MEVEASAPEVDLELEREKHRRRAEKFGVEYVDPAESRVYKQQALAERHADSGFSTGFDIFTKDEIEKRKQRAERFNLPEDAGLSWKGSEVVEDEEKKRQRAERFGTTYHPDAADGGLMDVDLYEERKEAPAEVERRPEAVYVYGVDLLSTRDLLEYFGDYGPKYIEWLNDSSANVIFREEETAKRAMAGLGEPMAGNDVPEGISVAQDPQAIYYMWHKGKDFQKSGSSIPLVFRTATVLDIKPVEKAPSRRLWVGLQSRGAKKQGRGGGKQGRFKSHGGILKHSRGHRNRRSYHDGMRHSDDGMFDEAMGGEARGRGSVRFRRDEDERTTPRRRPVNYSDL